MQIVNQKVWATSMNRTLLKLPSLRVAEWCRPGSWGRLLSENVNTAPGRPTAAGPVWRGRARAFSVTAAAAPVEDLADGGGKKVKRLSREERAALVESFVLQHREAHGGEFPTTSLVVKEVGGGRQIVKDILDALQKQLVGHEAEVEAEQSEPGPLSAAPGLRVNGVKGGRVEEGEGLGKVGTVKAEALEQEEAEDEEERFEGLGLEELVGSEDGDHQQEDEDEGEAEDGDEDEEEASEEKEPVLPAAVNGRKVEGTRRGEVESQTSLNWERLRAIGSNRRQETQGGDVKPRQAAPVKMSFFDGEYDDDEIAEDPVSRSAVKSVGNGGAVGHKEKIAENANGLFIRYLPPSASVQDIRDAFDMFGEITRVNMVPPRRPDSKFTFGFVNFKTESAFTNALHAENIFIRGSRVKTEPQQKDTRFLKQEGFGGSDEAGLDAGLRQERASSRSLHAGPQKWSVGFAVAVENLPVDVSVIHVRESMSAHGEILDSFARRGPAGVVCFVEYKTEEARESALASRFMEVPGGGEPCRITRVDDPVSPVVRLSNFAPDTTESTLLSYCRRFGQVDRVVSRREGVADVYFNDAELKQMNRILNHLNSVTMHQRRWRARLAPRLSALGASTILKTPSGQDWVRTQQLRTLANVEEALKKLAVDVEDARDLLSLVETPPSRIRDVHSNLLRN